MKLENSGENPLPVETTLPIFFRFQRAGSRRNYRELDLRNGSRADVFWPLTGQADGKCLCRRRSELGHFSSSDRPYLISDRCGRICGVMKMHLEKTAGNPPPTAIPLPVFSRFRLDVTRADCREITSKNGWGVRIPARPPVNNHLCCNYLKLVRDLAPSAPYLIRGRFRRVDGVMKINLQHPSETRRPSCSQDLTPARSYPPTTATAGQCPPLGSSTIPFHPASSANEYGP